MALKHLLSNRRLVSFQFTRNCSRIGIPQLRLFTKDPCQLCSEAKDKLLELPQDQQERFKLVEVDITAEGNEDLYDLYRYEIPVFFLETKYVCKNRINIEKLLKALDEHEKK